MNKQKATLYLYTLVSTPEKGRKVIYKGHVSKVHIINGEDIFLTQLAREVGESLRVSDLQEIQCVYHELRDSITRIIPLSRDDYEYAVNHIGEKVDIELLDVMGMTNWSHETAIATIIPKGDDWDEIFDNCDVKITDEFKKTYFAIKKEFKKNYHPPVKIIIP